ncbi:MAG: hypothetical protein SOH59_05530 [Heyndrickxia faecalis]|jgi:phosphate starvation-inducible membrane PsiE|uniref:Uncharacterized protein n=2 Tax=Heyndrickxia coagulans TaxID=1398 RepID=G2TNB5_HEYCO|nr:MULTISPECIES: hypothetical protein [Heyndrickxia]NWN95130.1 hypothetical protein [Bacillus sp. (in: firmicutes)]AEP01624.1 hypothetical protein Bcoa_2446 [Heyndrickxia coagulans 36D1]APB36768.1 hypothetical protein BIZ35_07865 [Heyndrickxia coagulans]AVD56784.1 hypothetical protein C3766_11810 [Heyndrickxia coagulans]AWP37646.1 hypothetical protein CYJ15_11810 [Heyndrickxia coagulans]
MDLLVFFKVITGIILLVLTIFIIRKLQNNRVDDYDKYDSLLLFLLVFDLIVLPIWGYFLSK